MESDLRTEFECILSKRQSCQSSQESQARSVVVFLRVGRELFDLAMKVKGKRKAGGALGSTSSFVECPGGRSDIGLLNKGREEVFF